MIEASHVVERYSPDMLLTPHCHYSIEVNCFRLGKGTYSVAGQTYEIRPDTVFVFGSNVIHSITSIDPEQALDVLKVHFSPSILWENPQFAPFDEIQNLESALTIDQLAKMAKMSKNSYLLWFKHFNGVSPYSYIQSKRVLKAIDLLKQQKLTVTQIAFECGYNNTVSFNKAFKKVMGCTPSELKSNTF